MKTKHIIINGDSRHMHELQDTSVQLIVTSPPYWQLKDYGIQEQIGFNENYEDYINNLNLVWKECHRVLENGCRLCINIGDQFARSVYYGRYKVIPIRTEIIKFCESIGFDYMGAIIWQKKTTTNTTGGASIMGSFPTPRNGIISIDYEFILLFKKLGTPRRIDNEVKKDSTLSKEEWRDYFSGHWNFGGARQNGHIAMFPAELPRRLIKMFSFIEETVLDPFLGSGTTSLAARDLGRNSVGYEINSEFIPLIRDKLQIDQIDIGKSEYKFVTQGNEAKNWHEEIRKLPYVFKDPHFLDKKIDLKKLQFGSKLDKNSSSREDYYSVEEVISPEFVKLDNGLTVRLIGIRQNNQVNGKAIDFLRAKTRNQKVYLKFDSEKFDEDQNLLCYLYLKNKTHINAHLIKNGLADVDFTRDYKYKSRFVKLGKYE